VWQWPFWTRVLLERGSQFSHVKRKTWREKPSNIMSRRDIAKHDAQILEEIYLHDGIIPDSRDSSSDHGYNQSHRLQKNYGDRFSRGCRHIMRLIERMCSSPNTWFKPWDVEGAGMETILVYVEALWKIEVVLHPEGEEIELPIDKEEEIPLVS
jgi:hypothetical protein